ncbi:hypothetical protein ACQEU3_10750 [Spirillospora sp. CA-253888]
MTRKKLVLSGVGLVLAVLLMEFAALKLGSLELPLPKAPGSEAAVADQPAPPVP